MVQTNEVRRTPSGKMQPSSPGAVLWASDIPQAGKSKRAAGHVGATARLTSRGVDWPAQPYLNRTEWRANAVKWKEEIVPAIIFLVHIAREPAFQDQRAEVVATHRELPLALRSREPGR